MSTSRWISGNLPAGKVPGWDKAVVSFALTYSHFGKNSLPYEHKTRISSSMSTVELAA
jgi:hypothetical protein